MNRPTTPDLRQRAPTVYAGVAFLVHSKVCISVAAASWAVSTMLLLDYPLRPGPPFIAFAVTMFVYSLNLVTDLDEDEHNVPRRVAFTRSYGRAWLALGAGLYLAAVCLALAWHLPRVEFMCLPLVVGLLYSTFRVKRVFLVKNLLVGVSWGVIPLGVCAYFGGDWTAGVAVLFGYVSAMLTVAAVVFDVKDVDGDAANGIRTVPTAFGPRTTRRLAAGANVAVAAAVVGLVAGGVVGRRFLALLVVNLYVLAYTAVATPDRGPAFYGLIADGEHLFLAAVLFALEAL